MIPNGPLVKAGRASLAIESAPALDPQILLHLDELITGQEIERPDTAFAGLRAEDVPETDGFDAPGLRVGADLNGGRTEIRPGENECTRGTGGCVDKRPGECWDPGQVARTAEILDIGAPFQNEAGHLEAEAPVGIAPEPGTHSQTVNRVVAETVLARQNCCTRRTHQAG